MHNVIILLYIKQIYIYIYIYRNGKYSKQCKNKERKANKQMENEHEKIAQTMHTVFILFYI